MLRHASKLAATSPNSRMIPRDSQAGFEEERSFVISVGSERSVPHDHRANCFLRYDVSMPVVSAIGLKVRRRKREPHATLAQLIADAGACFPESRMPDRIVSLEYVKPSESL